MQEPNNNNSLEEYRLASENIRHQDQMFFVNLTVFATVTGAAIVCIFTTNPCPSKEYKFYVEFGAFIFSFGLWVNANIYSYRWHQFFNRAVELEKTRLKDFNQYSSAWEAKTYMRHPITLFFLIWRHLGTFFSNLIYGCVTIFWLIRSIQ